jgi:hypothetical protein
MPIEATDIDQMKKSSDEYIVAADLNGQKVTVEISDINAKEMHDEEKEAPERMYFLSFKGKKKTLGINRTNTILISKMFGRNPQKWVGKRIVIYPTKTRMAGEEVPCIRVYGSPDIGNDINVNAALGRKRLKTTLRAIAAGAKSAPAQAPKQDVDPAVIEAWGVLGWTPQECEQNRAEFKGTDYAGFLSTLIDEMNAREGSGL